MPVRDDLGDRMKANYEGRSRYYLPRRSYTIIRVDGKAFHTFTRGCDRPFDERLMRWMNETALALCAQITGCRFAYVQSDEISLLLTDFGTAQTEAWFDGNLSKILSISASIATAAFNQTRLTDLFVTAAKRSDEEPPDHAAIVGAPFAQFDSRAFVIPDPVEVENYFIWRGQDATRNAVQMLAQAHFPASKLHGEDINTLQEMLWSEKGINFNDLPAGKKRGRFVERITTLKDVEYTDRRTGEVHRAESVARSEWIVTEPPIFTQDREFLRSRIPQVGAQ